MNNVQCITAQNTTKIEVCDSAVVVLQTVIKCDCYNTSQCQHVVHCYAQNCV
jgi:hypothetical protein